MKKCMIVLLAMALVCVLATSSFAAFTQIGIENNKVAVASVAGGTVFDAEWKVVGTGVVADPQQGDFGSGINVASADVYKLSTNYLEVTLQTNEYADYAACIYLRNWDVDANYQMTLSATAANLDKGLVHSTGTAVLPIKWGREFGATPGVPDSQSSPLLPKTETAATFTDVDGGGEGLGNWKWFLDETYQYDPPADPGPPIVDEVPDSQFRTDSGKLTYATFITKADIDWSSDVTTEIYFMAWYKQGMRSGSYRTNTMTVEAYYE